MVPVRLGCPAKKSHQVGVQGVQCCNLVKFGFKPWPGLTNWYGTSEVGMSSDSPRTIKVFCVQDFSILYLVDDSGYRN